MICRKQSGNFEYVRSKPLADCHSPEDVFIVVMGMTGTGKTKFISLCTGEPFLEDSNNTLLSCKHPHNRVPARSIN